MGIVRTHTNVSDDSFFFQFLCIFQNRSFKNGLEIFLIVNIMYHTDVDIVSMQTLQQISKRTFCFFNIPSAGIGQWVLRIQTKPSAQTVVISVFGKACMEKAGTVHKTVPA